MPGRRSFLPPKRCLQAFARTGKHRLDVNGLHPLSTCLLLRMLNCAHLVIVRNAPATLKKSKPAHDVFADGFDPKQRGALGRPSRDQAGAAAVTSSAKAPIPIGHALVARTVSSSDDESSVLVSEPESPVPTPTKPPGRRLGKTRTKPAGRRGQLAVVDDGSDVDDPNVFDEEEPMVQDQEANARPAAGRGRPVRSFFLLCVFQILIRHIFFPLV
jgi:hypothetical protein